jgi:hypothetical protein
MTIAGKITENVTVPTQVVRGEARADPDIPVEDIAAGDVARGPFSGELPHSHSSRCYWDMFECRWQCRE